ncbi:hypothetical protein KPH14_012397 [Odynerus spinipes]|uniref:Large ribosomal subunit protein bL9m n=1 Tax=Odynerus spinipes TaxID=1348599 RepID=A0AAD9RI53_9HYME|nr:hypothetical protein KPH14_012397 [Odynerus spinipes]
MLRSITFFADHLKTLIAPVLQNKSTDFMYQQTRNTFILKRKNPVPLHKKNQRPKLLKAKHFIYRLVEDTNVKKKEPIKVILTSDVKEVGTKGEIVSMHPERAYNTILLPKLGVYATPENEEKYMIENIQTEPMLPLTVQRTLDLLSTFSLSVSLSQEVSWTLEKWHVRTSFRKAGFHMPDEAIKMPERTISGPDLSIEGKQFYVTVTINNSHEVKVRCKIHHLPSDIKDATFISNFWQKVTDPIFPEDKPILDSMPLPRNIHVSK